MLSSLLIDTLIPVDVVASPTYVGIRNGLDVAYGAFLIGGIARRSALRGTYPRYRWATIQRAACWPGLIFIALTAIRAVGLNQWLGMLFVPCAMAAWAYTYNQMRADGDDNWFSRTGRRLHSALTRSVGRGAFAPGSA